MPTGFICAGCGAEIPIDAPEGLCTRCLLIAGLGSNPTPHRGTEPPAPADPTAARTPGVIEGERFGDWELLAEIGQGPVGRVFRARRAGGSEVTALKLIDARICGSPEARTRFEADTRVAAKLRHPGIVSLYAAGVLDNRLYLSMEWVEAESLAELIGRQEFLTAGGGEGPRTARTETRLQERVARLIASCARAVDHAHAQGLSHGNLKPGNILMDARVEPRVTDFALASLTWGWGRAVAGGDSPGVPDYCSPEQVRGEPLNPGADVFSLGSILYELLTGVPPFQARTRVETLRRVVDLEPSLPQVLNPHVDVDMSAICLKCLAKSSSQRYPSAAALAEDLDRWLRHEPIHDEPAGLVPRISRWIRSSLAGSG